jgi:hypothetical protein
MCDALTIRTEYGVTGINEFKTKFIFSKTALVDLCKYNLSYHPSTNIILFHAILDYARPDYK